jgi:phage terminase large subunit-like protein
LTVEYYTGGSKIRIIPETRAKQAQGFNATFALFDEIASYRTGEIITKIASGQVRENAIRISLTTAETSMQNPGRAEYDRARNVLTGKFEARNYLPLIYELDDHDDRWNPDCYIKANPALDAIKPLRKLIEERDRARQNPIEEASFFAYQLNVWSQNSGADISDDDWRPAMDNAKKYADYLTPDKLAKYPAVAAVDLSKIDDYTAYAIYFYIKPIDKFFAKHRFYIPAAAVENKQRIETEQVRIWIKQGYITPTEDGSGSRVINYEYLEQDIIEDYSKYHLIGLTYDVAHASRFVERLEEKLPQLPLIPFAQGWKKISPANKQWLELIYKQKLIDDNPVMRWMAGCARIINDRLGNTYFEKVNYRQSNLRIDGVDTSVMALAVLLGQLEQGGDNVEEQVKALEAIEY